MVSTKDLYKYHSKNLRQVAIGMERVGRTMRHAIATKDAETTDSLLRLYALLLGAWAECRLKKLLYEDSVDTTIRQAVQSAGAQHERWGKCIELGFRRRFNIRAAKLSASVMPFSAFSRYEALVSLINDQIKPVIELRNRLAHGQWFYLLSSDEESVSTELMAAIRKENLMSLQFKRDLLEYASALINDLMVSVVAFDRDFDKHYKLVENTKLNLKNRNYSDYEQMLRRKLQTGRLRHKSAIEGGA